MLVEKSCVPLPIAPSRRPIIECRDEDEVCSKSKYRYLIALSVFWHSFAGCDRSYLLKLNGGTMKHLLICREYPPAPSGGIGTYAHTISRLLAEYGETVHVIGQLWEGAEKAVEEQCRGKLIIHRVPYENWKSLLKGRAHPAILRGLSRNLFYSDLRAQCFSWQASLLAEKLVAAEGIDLVEAQEYEAPLYYFQLRRALGLGPELLPPCFIHLHSPSEFIARYNSWKPDSPSIAAAKRLEGQSIGAADALICPSRFLARQAEKHYRIATGTVFVIPYPIGEIVQCERNQNTWEHGTILYIGRLEPRKGILEWIDAAVAAARNNPAIIFEFIGANALGPNRIEGEDVLRRLIPKDVRSRFVVRGEQEHSSIQSFLRNARLAVVPSRWENFPYSCIEALGSGLPVIATREGGMAEMIRDGTSGWLAHEATSAGLGEALQRALETPWMRLSEMGREAAQDIRRLCDNRKVLEAHMAIREGFLNRGIRHSPAALASVFLPERPQSDSAEHHLVQLIQQTKRKTSFFKRQWMQNAAYALAHPVRTVLWLSRQIRNSR
jgi:glycogen synthase